MKTKLIVALDYANANDAWNLIEQIDPALCALKVGNELFTTLGPDFIRSLVKKNYRIFLDLKFHDIPNTVAQACRAAAALGVWMINVHASGGRKMMTAAKAALDACEGPRPLLIAVTVLTSMDEAEWATLGAANSLENQVIHLAHLAYQCGLDGVVCSAQEVPQLKSCCSSDFLTVTPGIRLPDDNNHDQVRVTTPQEAQKLGSDYLVIGRPITHSSQPKQVIHDIAASLQ